MSSSLSHWRRLRQLRVWSNNIPAQPSWAAARAIRVWGGTPYFSPKYCRYAQLSYSTWLYTRWYENVCVWRLSLSLYVNVVDIFTTTTSSLAFLLDTHHYFLHLPTVLLHGVGDGVFVGVFQFSYFWYFGSLFEQILHHDCLLLW